MGQCGYVPTEDPPDSGVAWAKKGAGSGGGDGGRGWDSARTRRFRVAEENYELTKTWPVPWTSRVTLSDCRHVHPRRSNSSSCLPCCSKGGPAAAKFVTWSKLTTAEAALQMASAPGCREGRVCVLNFANGSDAHVGGGYKRGAQAQEEDLCRRMPNLYSSLLRAKKQSMYPFGPGTYLGGKDPVRYSDVLFTPDVVLARCSEADNFAVLDEREQVKVSVVTAAAPNVAFAKEAVIPELLANTVRTIFLAPKFKQPSLTKLILGAWGCGAFGGDPKMMGQLFADAIAQEGLGALYDEVHFAIPEDPGNQNAATFRQALVKAGIQIRGQ